MAGENLIAIDVGTGSVRCAVFDIRGNLIAFAQEAWDYESPPETFGIGKEFNCDQLWNRIIRLIKEAMKKGKLVKENILGVSSTSQREGAVFLDKEGKELYGGPNIDIRGMLVGGKVQEMVWPEFQKITGHWPPSMFAPARMIWFRENKPEVYKKIGHILMINDWVLYKLSGVYSSEPSNAAESFLFDIKNMTWSQEIIESFQISPEILPEVYPSGTVVGEVTSEVSNLTGLKKGTPVVSGGADTQCAVIAAGALNEGQICTIAGTTTPIQMVVSKPIIDPNRKIWTDCHVVPKRWIVESNSGIMGRVLEWFKNWILDLGLDEAVKNKSNIYELLNKWALEAPLGASGVRASMGPQIMDFSKELSVGPAVIIAPSLLLVGDALSMKNMIRAIFENLAFAIRANSEQIVEVSKIKFDTMRITGGVSKNKTLLKILADCLGLPVITPKVKEGSSLGCAMCVAVGTGVYGNFNEAVKSMITWDKTIEPDDAIHEQYEGIYSEWKNLYSKMLNLQK
ncbi:MAG: FGGY-family carbohydrate kinase [Candidatus Jordarchaeum sp.]|uniref:FGGY-family carbohydrate kinase n=1 Tax=Candidatus Jordarchaeum sp. TaxID=2823881 RepID=UPI00404B09F0